LAKPCYTIHIVNSKESEMDFWTWLESCPVKYEVDDLQGFDGVSVAFYPPSEDEEDAE